MFKVAIVTGSSRGIGKYIADNLKDYIVVDTYNTTVNNSIHLDVSSLDSCKQLVNNTFNKYGRIDLLINNAAIMPRIDFKDITESQWNKIFQVNMTGTFMMTQLVLTKMKKGNIINLSSIAAKKGGRVCVPYAASKAAIENFTISISNLYAPDIRCNAIAPGRIQTDLLPNEHFTFNDIPMNRIGQPEDVFKAVKYILDNAYVTGQVINVNGGLS
jgi:NAD(P)-dependent dehydrogenase (short-subunit alcohol dehydrogenase family)